MKKLIFIILTVFSFNAFSQGIGDIAPEKELIKFPPNSIGFDIMFSEGGFGLGGFYRHSMTNNLSYFLEFSISEAKDQNEMEYVNYWGNTTVYGKKNRVFVMPLLAGLSYRVFSSNLGDNFRPFISAALGPSTIVTTPYEREFFNSFRMAQARYTAGGYIGIGANFGSDQKALMGISFRYYVTHFFNQGVESLAGRFQKDLGGFYIVLNIGSMY